MTDDQIINDLKDTYGTEFTAADVRGYCASTGVSYQTVTKRLEDFKVSRGKWNLEVTKETIKDLEVTYNGPAALPAVEQNLIPQKDDSFVKFGNFGDIKKIIQSGLFYPTFITGLSGNGKTFSVEQACAQLGRELIRVNITIETDEDDLIGGFRLIDGNTVWHNGQSLKYSNEVSCSLTRSTLPLIKFSVSKASLKGREFSLKKSDGELTLQVDSTSSPLPTLKVKVATTDDSLELTCSTKAFLERFPVTFEQEYPTSAIEQKILSKLCADENFCKRLADWADIIRKTFYDGGIEDVISTRRLVHIVRAHRIFGDKAKAIQVCLNRFDDDTKQAFLELYDKVDADFEMPIDGQGID